jgi:hypothetical protein
MIEVLVGVIFAIVEPMTLPLIAVIEAMAAIPEAILDGLLDW